MTEVIGFSHKELIEMMLSSGIHCSVDKFKSLALEIQKRAISAAALDRMDAEELNLNGEVK